MIRPMAAYQPVRAVCPACGVAVVPGYVKCPKCHAGLPLAGGRTKRMTGDPGGTAVHLNPAQMLGWRVRTRSNTGASNDAGMLWVGVEGGT